MTGNALGAAPGFEYLGAMLWRRWPPSVPVYGSIGGGPHAAMIAEGGRAAILALGNHGVMRLCDLVDRGVVTFRAAVLLARVNPAALRALCNDGDVG